MDSVMRRDAEGSLGDHLPDPVLLEQRLVRSIERARRYPGFHYAILRVELGLRAGGAPPVGDEDALLRAAARRLEACLRVTELPPTLRHGDLVVHLHDDQFAILLDGLKEVGHAIIAADRVLAELWLSFEVGTEVRLPASIGIALSASGYERPADVLRDAGIAMERARHLGGGCCEVSSSTSTSRWPVGCSTSKGWPGPGGRASSAPAAPGSSSAVTALTAPSTPIAVCGWVGIKVRVQMAPPSRAALIKVVLGTGAWLTMV